MTWVTSRVEYTGMAYNRWDIKRGTQFEVSTVAEAERLVADGRADFGKVKPDKLGRPHEKSPDEALLRRVAQRTRDSIPEESRPNPNLQAVVGSPYSRAWPADGWLGP
jgi:hypothetical protein